MIVATVATNSGVAPLSMPVTLDDTRSSANGNSVSGSASQTTPSIATRQRSARSIGARAAGNASSVANPNSTRSGVISAGSNESSPSAMK